MPKLPKKHEPRINVSLIGADVTLILKLQRIVEKRLHMKVSLSKLVHLALLKYESLDDAD